MDRSDVHTFLHCSRCLPRRPHNVAPREWARLEVGATATGILIWCQRCDVQIAHLILKKPMPQRCLLCEQGVPHDHGERR